jgi:hypothetical protein
MVTIERIDRNTVTGELNGATAVGENAFEFDGISAGILIRGISRVASFLAGAGGSLGS